MFGDWRDNLPASVQRILGYVNPISSAAAAEAPTLSDSLTVGRAPTLGLGPAGQSPSGAAVSPYNLPPGLTSILPTMNGGLPTSQAFGGGAPVAMPYPAGAGPVALNDPTTGKPVPGGRPYLGPEPDPRLGGAAVRGWGPIGSSGDVTFDASPVWSPQTVTQGVERPTAAQPIRSAAGGKISPKARAQVPAAAAMAPGWGVFDRANADVAGGMTVPGALAGGRSGRGGGGPAQMGMFDFSKLFNRNS